MKDDQGIFGFYTKMFHAHLKVHIVHWQHRERLEEIALSPFSGAALQYAMQV
jgi:hypothetical protein